MVLNSDQGRDQAADNACDSSANQYADSVSHLANRQENVRCKGATNNERQASILFRISRSLISFRHGCTLSKGAIYPKPVNMTTAISADIRCREATM